MRQVILDTETTGLSTQLGNRIVEIGAIELVERRPSGRHYHQYIHPDREFEAGAQEVTGLTLEFLADKPRFAEIVDEFLAFIDGAELIIHNAAFDIGFLDYELSLAGAQHGCIGDRCSVVDSLALARERYPGQRNSLDALCKRLGVDNAHRKLHGALLDAQLLAEVYIGLTSGQDDLGFGALDDAAAAGFVVSAAARSAPRRVLRASVEEIRAHEVRLEQIGKAAGKAGRSAIWGASEPTPAGEAVPA
ncbi:DNA polymerase III subunit epsilon [Coralloluteibacterium stylophorae]|uniref:DNA polymerase III subunit epsilon n=1 Tax=Coralloluteibacterium stylophorae TaxID=1776034 RepID=A0AAP2CDU3_9GAMM|nr:DNA polymerase III subunit epsilon [Coralloluteibacterium stylophorae]MBS7457657.1 DNA polymerase III subunit epsilon [Coralloluteibacterium stylophorae]